MHSGVSLKWWTRRIRWHLTECNFENDFFIISINDDVKKSDEHFPRKERSERALTDVWFSQRKEKE